MNPQVMRILSGVERLSAEHVVSWESMVEARDKDLIEYMQTKNRNASFAHEIVKRLNEKWPGDIIKTDEVHGEVQRFQLYVLPRREMIELLEKAYNAGATDWRDRSRMLGIGERNGLA